MNLPTQTAGGNQLHSGTKEKTISSTRSFYHGTTKLNIRYEPCFLPQPEPLFQFLTSETSWDTSLFSRKTACFGVPYNYSGMTYSFVPFPLCFLPMLGRLEELFGYRSNNCLLNYYETGTAKMGFLADSNRDLVPGTGVAIVSLGESRTLVFRAKHNKSEEHFLRLGQGSLLYMFPDVQDLWLHALPPEPEAGPRISLTFRRLPGAGLEGVG